MAPRFGLQETTIQKISDILARHPEVDKAILYGSRAKGNYKTGSDIDLTLCGGDDLTLDVLHKIMGEFDESPLPYTIDLSLLKNISDPEVVEHIRRVGSIFYEKIPPQDAAVS